VVFETRMSGGVETGDTGGELLMFHKHPSLAFASSLSQWQDSPLHTQTSNVSVPASWRPTLPHKQPADEDWPVA